MFIRGLLIAGAIATIGVAQTQEAGVAGRVTAGVAARKMVGSFTQAEFAGQVVKNAPYSAEASTESIQKLTDGNRIVRRDVVSIARDTEGRTRRDVAVPGLASKVTVIHDPVANVSYTLNHESKTARKMTGRGVMVQVEAKATAPPPPQAGAGPAAGDVVMFSPATAVPMWEAKDLVLEGGPTTFNVRVGSKENSKTESLGKKTIEGVIAEGTRITNVIPAGEIGNERAIEIVFERWYSPELQILISSSHKDPMMGETTYKLTNLTRGEPMRSLFEVPSDYTVQDAPEPAFHFQTKIDKE